MGPNRRLCLVCPEILESGTRHPNVEDRALRVSMSPMDPRSQRSEPPGRVTLGSMPKAHNPNFQPISALRMIASTLDGQLRDNELQSEIPRQTYPRGIMEG